MSREEIDCWYEENFVHAGQVIFVEESTDAVDAADDFRFSVCVDDGTSLVVSVEEVTVEEFLFLQLGTLVTKFDVGFGLIPSREYLLPFHCLVSFSSIQLVVGGLEVGIEEAIKRSFKSGGRRMM